VVIQLNLSHVDLNDIYTAAGSCSPWALLGAAPGLRSLRLRISQAGSLLGSPHSCFQGIAARLTRLELERDSSGWVELPQVLAICTGLRQLWLGRSQHPYSRGVSIFPDAVSQLGQLPIEYLEVDGVYPAFWPEESGDGQDGLSTPGIWCYQPNNRAWLLALPGLKELRVRGHHRAAEPLDHLCKLTKLSWTCEHMGIVPPEVSLLTQLRHLELDSSRSGFGKLPTYSYSSLTRVTQLQLSLRPHEVVPEQLGDWMPSLEVLKVHQRRGLPSLPAGLDRLTMLEAPVDSSSSELLDQLRACTTLVELRLRMGCDVDLGDSCSSLTRLEVLRLLRDATLGAPSETAPGWRGLQLGALHRLRSLSLCGGSGMGAALASAAGCTQLTQLQLEPEGPLHPEGPPMQQAQAEQLFRVGLPHLQQLRLSSQLFPYPGQLGAWLGFKAQLTRLVLAGNTGLVSSAALEQLPVGLCELQLPGLQVEAVPACLARLQQLRRLSLGARAAPVQQLPAWLSALQHLEWLDVSGTRVTSPQPVLGQLPLLRRVVLPRCSTAGVVLSHAPHLLLCMDAG
jgi:hypothetical protein